MCVFLFCFFVFRCASSGSCSSSILYCDVRLLPELVTNPNPFLPQGVSAAAKMFCTTHFTFRHLYSIGSTCIFIGSHGTRDRCDFTTLSCERLPGKTQRQIVLPTRAPDEKNSAVQHTCSPFHTQELNIIYFCQKNNKRFQQFLNAFILYRWILQNTFWDELANGSCAIWIGGMC